MRYRLFYIPMTDLSFDVLRRLADGEFHSGATLARTLGVSRGTVWNAVRAIDAAGLSVYKVRGRGYRLAEPISLLDHATVAAHAGAYSQRWAIELLDAVDSTNTLLMQRAAHGAPSGTVIAAECQRDGRGRMGRPWHAGVGGALTFSALWRFDLGAGALGGLSLAAGVALIRALKELGTDEARLKWPNDVVWRGQKLAGMLIEMQGDALGPSTVVIGIGVNVRLSDPVKSRIDQPAADLEAACGRTLDRSAVLGTVLAQLAIVLDRFAEDGFAPMREEWQRYHVHQGRSVAVKLPTGRVERGLALGVGDDGALLFQTGEAVRRLHSGEISLRGSDPAKTPRAQKARRVRSRA
jgi:BirA family biotin operon repressor/biotin-[acetyl-CoA-carboxylase] ligase